MGELVLGLRNEPKLSELLNLPKHIQQKSIDGTRGGQEEFEKVFQKMMNQNDSERKINFQHFANQIIQNEQEKQKNDMIQKEMEKKLMMYAKEANEAKQLLSKREEEWKHAMAAAENATQEAISKAFQVKEFANKWKKKSNLNKNINTKMNQDATVEALRLENVAFKKALEREAKESEKNKTALNEHQDVATRLREELEAAVQIQKELGQHSDSKNMKMERLKNMLEDERKKINQLETEMQQKELENKNLAQLALEKTKRNRLHQIALYEQQMEELKQLRIADSSRLKEHEEQSKKLQQELELEERERARLTATVNTGNQENKAALVSLQEQMAIKEQQLKLQRQSMVLAQDHESKAYQLEQKLRKEQEAYKSLEIRLKELEESKQSSSDASEVRMQELTSAVEEAGRAANNRETKTSKELERMRKQFEKERREHQQKLLETIKKEIQQAKTDTESNNKIQDRLMEEMKRMQQREQIEEEARLNAEKEREQKKKKKKEQNEASLFERNLIDSELKKTKK